MGFGLSHLAYSAVVSLALAPTLSSEDPSAYRLPPPLSVDWSSSTVSSPSRNWVRLLSRWNWLSALAIGFLALAMSPGPLAPSLTLIHYALILWAGFAMAWRSFIIVPWSLNLGMGYMTLRSGSQGWGAMFLSQWPLLLVPRLALALSSTWALGSSLLSSPWGPSCRLDNGLYFTLVPGGGPRSPLWTYVLPKVLFNLSCNMLHGLRLKSALAHGGEALVEPLHQVQDDLPIRATSHLFKGCIPPSL